MRRLVMCTLLVVLGFCATNFAQSTKDGTEAQKLQLERDKFEYEKYQSTRNLILGFLITTAGGAYLTWFLGARTWRRQTKIDLYRKRFEEATAFLDAFSKSVGERFFLMQRYLWAIGDEDLERAKRLEKEYFQSVITWNSTYWVNRNKIRLALDDTHANLFLDYGDERRLENPQSLHYTFVKAHREVQKARAGEISKELAQAAVNSLNWLCCSYLENLTTSFLDRAVSLQLLKPPSTRVSSLQIAIEQRQVTISGAWTAPNHERPNKGDDL